MAPFIESIENYSKVFGTCESILGYLMLETLGKDASAVGWD